MLISQMFLDRSEDMEVTCEVRSVMHGTGGEGNIFHAPAPVVSAVMAHKTFGSTNLTSTYSVCTRCVFGDIEHRMQTLRFEV
ncbi:hypothetical protein TNCV_1228801 [Trichonephila clavipes]|nr:hypothetical protein TNCV_1228801 [Trichonephila clavipes]